MGIPPVAPREKVGGHIDEEIKLADLEALVLEEVETRIACEHSRMRAGKS